jgi:hypothetical protein
MDQLLLSLPSSNIAGNMGKGKVFSILHRQRYQLNDENISKAYDRITAARDRIFHILVRMEEDAEKMRKEAGNPRKRTVMCYSEGSHSMAPLSDGRARLFRLIQCLAYKVSPPPSWQTQPLLHAYYEDEYVIQLEKIADIRREIVAKLMVLEARMESQNEDVKESVSFTRHLPDRKDWVDSSPTVTFKNERAALFKLVQEIIYAVPVPQGWETLQIGEI